MRYALVYLGKVKKVIDVNSYEELTKLPKLLSSYWIQVDNYPSLDLGSYLQSDNNGNLKILDSLYDIQSIDYLRESIMKLVRSNYIAAKEAGIMIFLNKVQYKIICTDDEVIKFISLLIYMKINKIEFHSIKLINSAGELLEVDSSINDMIEIFNIVKSKQISLRNKYLEIKSKIYSTNDRMTISSYANHKFN